MFPFCVFSAEPIENQNTSYYANAVRMTILAGNLIIPTKKTKGNYNLVL